MLKISLLAGLLAVGAVCAHADILEFSGFGGYTSVGMKQVNSALTAGPKSVGADPTTTTNFANGYVVGLDLRSGVLIPIPFLEVGLRGEYVGTNPAGADGTWAGQNYAITENASMADAMLGLDFGIGIPGTGLNLGLSAYGGYGEGFIQQSGKVAGVSGINDDYDGGAFVGEGEAKLGLKLYSVLSVYAFGGMRFANLGVFQDPAKDKFGGVLPGGSGSPEVDFSGVTGGLGLNLDF